MPFRSSPSSRRPIRVTKVAEPVNAELARELDALTREYRRALDALAAVVRTARENTLGGNLNQFQILVSDAAMAELQAGLASAAQAEARQAVRSGVRAMNQLPRALTAQFSFDNKDPRAIAWARQRAGSLIAQIEAETLDIIRTIIADSLNSGIPLGPTTERIQRVIGLHDRWQRAVENSFRKDYERLVGQGLRPEVAQRRANVAAEKYRNRLIKARAQNIARTELAAAQNYGQYLTWVQAADKGLINTGKTMKEWVAGPSGWRGVVVCDICAPMNGQKVPMNQAFSNGVLMPPAHPNCRCRAILIPPEVP